MSVRIKKRPSRPRKVSSGVTVESFTEGCFFEFTDSGNQLILAYQAVQKADSLGAPLDQVADLSTKLNDALGYYNTAIELYSEGNVTGSEHFSILSNNKSTIILANAIVLQQNAENSRTNKLLVTYTTAIIGAMLSAILVLEYHRIPNFFRKRKLFGIKLRQEDQNEP